MRNMFIVASTVAEDVDDEEKRLREAKAALGEDWTVTLGEGIPPCL